MSCLGPALAGSGSLWRSAQKRRGGRSQMLKDNYYVLVWFVCFLCFRGVSLLRVSLFRFLLLFWLFISYNCFALLPFVISHAFPAFCACLWFLILAFACFSTAFLHIPASCLLVAYCFRILFAFAVHGLCCRLLSICCFSSRHFMLLFFAFLAFHTFPIFSYCCWLFVALISSLCSSFRCSCEFCKFCGVCAREGRKEWKSSVHMMHLGCPFGCTRKHTRVGKSIPGSRRTFFKCRLPNLCFL